MPYKRKRKGKRSFKRKRRSRKGKRSGAMARYNRKQDWLFYKAPTPGGGYPSPFPAAYFCKIPVFFDFTQAAGGANFIIHEFGPNTLTDVNSGVGYEWAVRMMNLYNRYVCLAYKWKMTFFNRSEPASGESSAFSLYCLPWSENEDPTSEATIAFQKGVRHRIAAPAVISGSAAKTVMSGYVNLSQLTGVKDLGGEAAYWGTVSAPPTFQPKFYWACKNFDNVAESNFQVRIEFIGYFKFFASNQQGAGPSLASMPGVPFANMGDGKVDYHPCGGKRNQRYSVLKKGKEEMDKDIMEL